MARAKLALRQNGWRQVGFAPKWLAPSQPCQVGRAKSAAPNGTISLFCATNISSLISQHLKNGCLIHILNYFALQNIRTNFNQFILNLMRYIQRVSCS
ncbi:hypothetical protein Zmor_006335 [Zophobas morio]|uniref:Uncharacterized protein n=1 Tax=Zophobas morio TaxID=2755281 RepID=A0AA38IPU0_9CUCU|nr:hypothetical protein Zmor_006335 [Zophobas morio]